MRRQIPTVSNSTLAALIDEWIRSSRDRDILKMSLIDNISYEVIAERLEMSDKQIGRIVRRGVEEIIIQCPGNDK